MLHICGTLSVSLTSQNISCDFYMVIFIGSLKFANLGVS